MVNEIVLDTSALVEYADGTEKGKIVKEMIEDKENVVLVPSIVLAEFVSLLERKGFTNTPDFIDNLSEYTVCINLEAQQGINAGKRHAKLKKIEKDISLVDCIIMEVAEEHDGALILAKDPHFRNYKNARIL